MQNALQKMELSQLHAFVAIAQLKSFSAAAKQLSLSQPSLSRKLKQLEVALGVVLVDRYHRPLQLTIAGQFFYDKISPVLTEMATISQMTQRMVKPNKALNIGFVPSVLYGLLPEVIAKLKASQPDLEVTLKDISADQQIKALKSGDIDIGFGRFLHQDPWIRQILLRHERFVAALPKSHRLALASEPFCALTLADLVDNRLILYHQSRLPLPAAAANLADSDSLTEPLLNLFAQYGLTLRATTKVSDLQIALGLVAANEGVTLVPQALQSLREGQICYRPLLHENVTSPIYLHTLKDAPHPSANDLLQAVYQVYENHGITYRPQKF